MICMIDKKDNGQKPWSSCAAATASVMSPAGNDNKEEHHDETSRAYFLDLT
jgi:hypothetical protein